MPQRFLHPLTCFFAITIPAFADPPRRADAPRSHDPRLTVELFAAAPDIVHPIGIDFDSKGRLLVIESHTHFRPKDYKGPPHDRIRIVEDTDGDGKADRFTTFFEGTRFTMDIAVHFDGSVYLATRNEIIRLRDTKATGKADERTRIAFLDTPGDYPHNGLCGLAFDSRGDLYFGMGENLGATYKLTGADGTTIKGEGDGGHLFHCTADGKKLRRVATGFWNPFGTCLDIFGRIFTVDNDPDSSPPCRLVHVVEGADFGFQFRYGRSGRHPFQAWDGQLPGTLPMASGTGEAPCEILSYESDGLPKEYRGQLLVAVWADHRIERYELEERGASVKANRKPFIQGGTEFRPVGLAVAPDGSLFMSDWVRSDYNLHGKGTIWRARWKDRPKPQRPADPHDALFSNHRPLREAAARKLATTEEGRAFLRKQLADRGVRVRAACLAALLDVGDRNLDLSAIADKERHTSIRSMAVRALADRGKDVSRFLNCQQPAPFQFAAIPALQKPGDALRLLHFLEDDDPYLFHAAVHQLAKNPEVLSALDARPASVRGQKLGKLLAHRASRQQKSMERLPGYLADPDEDIRFLAAKWIADEKLSEFRPQVVEALKDRKLNVRMYLALATALARLDGREVSETKMADYFVDRLTDQELPTDTRVRMLQLVPGTHPKLKLDLLAALLSNGPPALQMEAVRALAEHPAAGRIPLLAESAKNSRLGERIRAQALVPYSEWSTNQIDEWVRMAREERPAFRDEALRALVGATLNERQRVGLVNVAKQTPAAAAMVARVLGKSFVENRPPKTDTDAWLKKLDGPADSAAGRRIFFHPKLAGCYRCHRAEGRGRDLGPDLSTTGQNARRHILESVLQPSLLVAPHYQVWQVEMNDGKVRTGMLVGTYLDDYTYLDEKGELFKVKTPDVAETRSVPKSIMPDGLVDVLTDQELRDLMAYLVSLR